MHCKDTQVKLIQQSISQYNCSFRPKMPTNEDIDLQIILNPNTVCVGIYQNSRRKMMWTLNNVKVL